MPAITTSWEWTAISISRSRRPCRKPRAGCNASAASPRPMPIRSPASASTSRSPKRSTTCSWSTRRFRRSSSPTTSPSGPPTSPRCPAHEEPARRDANLELGRLLHLDEGGRAILGVVERREKRVALAQAKELDRPLVAQEIDGARRAPLLGELVVAAGDAIELVGGVQADEIGDRLPLEDVRVDVDLVASKIERAARAIRIAHRGSELLGRGGLHADARSDLLARQRLVPLHAERQPAGDGAERDEQQADERAHGEAPDAQSKERHQSGAHQDDAEGTED